MDRKTLSYDPDPDAVGDTYHVVWVRLVSSITSWESSAGPGSAHGSGSISVIGDRSWHLDGYIVDHSTHASVQYMMVPGTVPLESLADLPDGFVPDMDGIYRLNYSNLLPNRTTVLDVDADVPRHDVGLVNAVDPYPGEKAWFLDPECTMRFDFGSTPITQANLVLYAPLVTNVNELPKTGGAGTGAHVVAGTVLVAVAGRSTPFAAPEMNVVYLRSMAAVIASSSRRITRSGAISSFSGRCPVKQQQYARSGKSFMSTPPSVWYTTQL